MSREFFGLTFMGDGGVSKIESFLVQKRLEEALNTVSGMQQFRKGQDLPGIYEEMERDLRDAVLDILAALTGKRYIPSPDDLPFPHYKPLRMGKTVITRHANDFLCLVCSQSVSIFPDHLKEQRGECVCTTCHRPWDQIVPAKCNKCKQHYLVFDGSGRMEGRTATVIPVNPNDSDVLEKLWKGIF